MNLIVRMPWLKWPMKQIITIVIVAAGFLCVNFTSDFSSSIENRSWVRFESKTWFGVNLVTQIQIVGWKFDFLSSINLSWAIIFELNSTRKKNSNAADIAYLHVCKIEWLNWLFSVFFSFVVCSNILDAGSQKNISALATS